MMGKMLCECGYIHSDTCGYDGDLFKYEEWDVSDEKSRDALDPISVFECPVCGNLMIDNPENRMQMITYRPGNGKYNKILHEKGVHDGND